MAEGPNRKWVADISYIWTTEGWLYLAAIMDLFSRKIVGWAMSPRINRHLVRKALQMAVVTRKPGTDLLHHSDRGSQYASYDYRTLLAGHQIQVSMSRTGNVYDNSVMESFFATLKAELVHRRHYLTRGGSSLLPDRGQEHGVVGRQPVRVDQAEDHGVAEQRLARLRHLLRRPVEPPQLVRGVLEPHQRRMHVVIGFEAQRHDVAQALEVDAHLRDVRGVEVDRAGRQGDGGRRLPE